MAVPLRLSQSFLCKDHEENVKSPDFRKSYLSALSMSANGAIFQNKSLDAE